jgi:hypothetical protein
MYHPYPMDKHGIVMRMVWMWVSAARCGYRAGRQGSGVDMMRQVFRAIRDGRDMRLINEWVRGISEGSRYLAKMEQL